MYSFIRINNKAISILSSHMFMILHYKFDELFVNLNIKKTNPIKKFLDLIGEFASDMLDGSGYKPKLDIAEIFEEDAKDLELIIELLKKAYILAEVEMNEAELFALNGTIEKIQKYYDSLIEGKNLN